MQTLPRLTLRIDQVAQILRRPTLNFNNFLSFYPFSTGWKPGIGYILKFLKLLLRHKTNENWSRSRNVVRSWWVEGRVSRSSGNRRVNQRTLLSFETKLSYTFVRRSHHSESETNLSSSNGSEMKKLSFCTIRMEKVGR